MMEEEIREEQLPEDEPIPEAGGIEPVDDTSRLNDEIPAVVGQIVFQSPPTSRLPPGMPPTEASEQAERYVNLTSPILHMVQFHTCLGGVAHLSPTARLIIGVSALLGGALIMKLPGRKRERKSNRVDHQPREEESTPHVSVTDRSPGGNADFAGNPDRSQSNFTTGGRGDSIRTPASEVGGIGPT
jgi:hypothetical protein